VEDLAAMTNPHDQDADLIVLYAGDDPVIADAVAPEVGRTEWTRRE
jgi:hypothetical protein